MTLDDVIKALEGVLVLESPDKVKLQNIGVMVKAYYMILNEKNSIDKRN